MFLWGAVRYLWGRISDPTRIPFLTRPYAETDRHISLPSKPVYHRPRYGGRNDSREVNRMPEFAQPFAGNNIDRTMTHNELIRAIRYTIAAEFEAIQLYNQMADATDNELAREVLKDIADEEKVHAGEFYRLLIELDPREKEFYQKGAEEVEEEIGKLRAKE